MHAVFFLDGIQCTSIVINLLKTLILSLMSIVCSMQRHVHHAGQLADADHPLLHLRLLTGADEQLLAGAEQEPVRRCAYARLHLPRRRRLDCGYGERSTLRMFYSFSQSSHIF